MKISALIQGLSIATVVLLAGLPAYGARIFITTPEAQLDDDPVLDVAGRPGGTVNWSGFIDTTGLTAPLQSITMYSSSSRLEDDPINGEVTGFNIVPNPEEFVFFPNLQEPVTYDPNTGLSTLLATRSGPPGLPPNSLLRIGNISVTLTDKLNNDGKVDYRIGVRSAIDVNGKDVTDQFIQPFGDYVTQEFEFQPATVPECSTIFGLVLAGGFGVFLKKQNRNVLS
jgi:hypothetical protein